MNSLESDKEIKKKTIEELASEFQSACLMIIISVTYFHISPYLVYVFGLTRVPYLPFLNILAAGLIILMVLLCLVRIIYRLFVHWKQLSSRLRLMRLIVFACGVLVLPLTIINIKNYNPWGPAYLRGFQRRILNKADIAAIRKWMAESNMPSEGPLSLKVNLKNAPPFIKKLKPDWVTIHEWPGGDGKLPFRLVNFRWISFPALLMEVGPPDMENPSLRYGTLVLPLEPGVYISTVSK